MLAASWTAQGLWRALLAGLLRTSAADRPHRGSPRHRRLAALAAFAAFTLAAAEPAKLDAAARRDLLEQLATRVRPDLGDQWQRLRREWQPRLDAAGTAGEFYGAVNGLLRAAGKSHLALVPPEVLGAAAPKATDGETGLEVKLIGTAGVIARVEPGSPAAAAGLRPGETLTAIGDFQVAGLVQALVASGLPPAKQCELFQAHLTGRLAGPAGTPVTLAGLDATDRALTRTLVRSPARGNLVHFGNLPPCRLTVEARRLGPGDGVGYLRFNIFLMALMPQLRAAVAGFADCAGVILDLRGNPGGLGLMAVPVAALFHGAETSLGNSKLPPDVELKYTVLPAPKFYAGPLIILVDELTGSTAEILAGGLQENGRALIVGATTMGAVLPSLLQVLPNGAQLQYPVGDFRTPKEVALEGRGVIPDLEVILTRDSLLADRDPVLTAALAVLAANPAPAAPATKPKEQQ